MSRGGNSQGSTREYREQRAIAIRRDGHTCRWCGDTVHPQCAPRQCDLCLNTDHLIPVAKGGSDKASNLIVACAWCNQSRGDSDKPEPKRPSAGAGTAMAGVVRSW